MPLGDPSGGPLSEARVTKIINDVTVVDPASGSRKAELQQVIKDQLGLKTGIKSRSELVFQDDTLTRIGPESYFSFKAGTREMSLEKGTLLLQVPKGLGGAKIRTAAVTAAITGTTIMMEYRPKQSIKVLVLEGSLRLSVNGRVGEALTLRPGQMVMMPADSKRIPAPVDVDLARVMKTSSLVNMSGGATAAALPSASLIRQEIAIQADAKQDRTLATTNLVVNGAGTDVRVTTDPTLQTISRRNDPALPTPSLEPSTSGDIGVPGTTGGSGNGNNGNGNNGSNGNHGNGNSGNGNGNTGQGNGPGGNGNGNNGNGNGSDSNGNGNGHGWQRQRQWRWKWRWKWKW